MSMVIYKSLGHLEVDYDKREVRAGGRRIDFGRISRYEFEHVQTEYVDCNPQDSDAREHGLFSYETMRVMGACEELPDLSPETERRAALVDEVGLKLWYYYFQCDELKESSLDFSQKDAMEARHKLKPLIKHLREKGNVNMFVGEEHLRIGGLASLNVPRKEFDLHRADLPVFGPCTVHAYGKDVIGRVCLITERKMREEEMLPMLEYMSQSMPMEPRYDDHGYGVMSKPHEVSLTWSLPQGEVTMEWDGFNYTRGNEPSHPSGDGLDFVRIILQDCALLRQFRDEAYYRSLVD